jgi:pimeloyl-ACP methyl ester carboxylesterase
VLPEVLRAARIRHAVLVGHSDGGSIAAVYAGSNGQRLLGLITIAAHFFVEDLNIASIRQIGAEYETTDLRQRLARYHRDPDNAFRGWNDAWLDPRFRVFDLTPLLPAIAVPILALQGADDPYGTEDQLRIFAAKVQVPITPRLIRGGKHAPHLEAKDETLALITDFITDLQRGSLT